MSGGKNCYPESDVLINQYNIRDKELLEKFEIQKVFAKLLGLDVKPERIRYTYDAEHLVNIYLVIFMNGREHSEKKICIRVSVFCPAVSQSMQIIMKLKND